MTDQPKPPEPTGGDAFDKLAKALVRVPRDQFEKEQRKYDRRKAKRKKKKS